MNRNIIISMVALTFGLPINVFADTPQPPAPSEPDGIIGGHEYVDLGLPSGTLWATYNVGASSPYEKGQYFAWGEVEPREDFSWESYKFFEDYVDDPVNGPYVVIENIGGDISGTEYDAARHQWGSGWRLPNEQERYELRMLCWHNGVSEENGVRGVRIYGPNEHSIFLPVCGYGSWYGDQDPFQNTDGAYWTGVEDPEYGYTGTPIETSNFAKSVLVDLSGLTGAHSMKAYGLNIRAVVNPKEAGIDNVISDSKTIALSYMDGKIHIIGDCPEGLITMCDLSGRAIFSEPVTEGIFQLPTLSSGIYIVSYSDKGLTLVTQKIIIK
ncbi:MAG: T9SS type A sorting domain-containing protein [Muribaculaceae bacterium]|nr:T9SS type A sorting domain-containing protein [Muribaculaceae bacterium]